MPPPARVLPLSVTPASPLFTVASPVPQPGAVEPGVPVGPGGPGEPAGGNKNSVWLPFVREYMQTLSGSLEGEARGRQGAGQGHEHARGRSHGVQNRYSGIASQVVKMVKGTIRPHPEAAA